MNYGEIKNCDIANGNGIRVSLFVSGCTNACKNCFQPQTWDFNYGKEYTDEVEDGIIKMLEHSYINGLSVLGGEPFEPKNQPRVYELLKRVRKELPQKDIWIFSGFTLEEMKDENAYPHTDLTLQMLNLIDVLVDGRFVEEKKDLSLRFRGSSNQRLIDMPKTLKKGEVVIWDEF